MPGSAETFWRVPVDELLRTLDSSVDGLSSAEAARKRRVAGPNAVTATRGGGLLVKAIRKLAEPLVLMLLVAAALSAATGEVASFVIIVSVIGLSITLDVVQEHRAELAAQALRRSVAIRADVRRDGRYVAIPVDEVVPGDVIELKAGDLVPADGVVISSRGAHANEALLTGEPFPTEKRAGTCDTNVPAEAFNALFAGTSIVSGQITMLAVATGPASRLGGIASALVSNEGPSAFERGVHRLGLLIIRLTIFLVLFVLLIHLTFGRPVLESFLFALALAVGLTPELLPMIMTVTLSSGAVRMAAKAVVVKRLSAIHDLGAMNVLCTDKTGTLTEARISLEGHPGPDGIDNDRIFTLALVNSAFSSGIRSPLDQAVIDHCTDARMAEWTKLDENPFDFERRSVTVLAQRRQERVVIIKGAPERILSLCTKVDGGDGRTTLLTDGQRADLLLMQEKEAARGYRTLGVAWKTIPNNRHELRDEDEQNLVFAGYCRFVDPPKASAAIAISRLSTLGVRVKVVSGDHEAIVRHVVAQLGIPAAGMLTGAELAKLTDAALAMRVTEVDLFSRVSPDQKRRIIRALQSGGQTVGFLGDGINDAPAIHAAEVGMSVEGATDVARSAADMILLARDLGVVADGVEEGRRTFANITKYIRMGTSSNFGNMLSMALASLLLPFLPMLPIQILLNNLLYDLSETGIPFDSVDPKDIAAPEAWDMKGIVRFTVVMGGLSSVFDLATFALLIMVFHADADLFRTAWFIESMATQILVIFIIRTPGPFWRSRASTLLATSSIAALVTSFAIVASPVGAWFSFTSVPAHLAAGIAVIVLTYLVLAEFAKRAAIAKRPLSSA